MPVLKTYRGVEIKVTETGQFQAHIARWGSDSHKELVSNAKLSEIEAAIDQSVPKDRKAEPIKLMHVSKARDYSGNVSHTYAKEPKSFFVAGVRHETVGRGKNAQKNDVLLDEQGKATSVSAGSTYLYDAAVEAELTEIVAQMHALAGKYVAATERLTPVTRDEIMARVEVSAV